MTHKQFSLYSLLTTKEVFMIIELLLENWLHIIIILAMGYGIYWLICDDATFWGDVERASKGLKTKKYFTEFNKK